MTGETAALPQSLKALAKRHQLDLIMLFGSQAKRKSHRLSDVDIAVHVKGNVADMDLLNTKLTIMVELQDIFKKSEVDVVTLNDAPTRLKYEIFKHGRALYCENQEAYREAYGRAVDDYLDFEPYLRTHFQEAKRYFAEASP